MPTTISRILRSNAWALSATCAAQLMVTLDVTIMIIALPSAQHSLGFSNSDRQWVITAYTLTFGGLLILGGRISDMVGPKRTLTLGVTGFALASAIGGAAQNFPMLIAARGLQGCFGALLTPSVLALINTRYTEPKERARAFGVYATMAAGGAAIGMILGGVLTQYLGWRWCLYVNLPIGAVILLSSTVIASRSRGNHHGIHLDIPGTVLGCGGLAALVFALGEAANYGWSSPSVILAFAIAAAALFAFCVVQTKVPDPILPLRILRDRNRAGSYLAILLTALGSYALFLMITYFLQTVNHYSPSAAGLGFLPMVIVNSIAATQLATRVIPYIRPRYVIAPGLLMLAGGTALLSQLTPGASFASSVLPSDLLIGVGSGLVMVTAIATATREADPRDIGITAAGASASMQIGTSIGTALLNTLAATGAASYLATHTHTAASVADATVHGYAIAAWCATGVIVAATILIGWMLTARSHRVPAARAAEVDAAIAEAPLAI